MSIELRQLRYAVATADAQSFSRAAATLRVKQSTLSRRVLLLEERLGVKLFERTTRGAEPTENGRVVIEQARRIVTDVDNLQTTARNVSYGLQGRISVGYCTSLMSGNLKLAFADYLTRFPDVQFDGIESGPDKLLHGLQSRMIDVVVAPAGLEEPGLKTRSLWSERLMTVLLNDNPLMEKERIYWQELRREVFVVSSGGLGPILGNLISARLTEQGFRPNIIYQDTSLESVLSMIVAKRYISVATEASQGVDWPDLKFREIYDSVGPARLEYALYWRDDNANPALKHFFKLIEERYPG
jgi:DNA-binding transcriptional LysR family regulator